MVIKAEKTGLGAIRQNGKLAIKAKKRGEGVIRPNRAFNIKAEKNGQWALRPTTKSCELFHQFLLVYKKKFPTNQT